MESKQGQWWVAFNLDPSAHPPQPQGALSAGWANVSPIFAPTAAEGADALCVFTTDYGATVYMQSLSAQQGGSHPIITEGLNSRRDLEQLAERFDVRYVAVNPSPAGEAEEVVELSEFLDRLDRLP
jgi:ABC-type branched-subunit amino acid transport system substrate-binding protein